MDPHIPKLPGYSVSVPVSAILAFGTLYNTGMCMLQQRVIQSAKNIYHSTFEGLTAHSNCPRSLKACCCCRAFPAQPCMEGKPLGRKQTLTYLKGYPQQDPDVSGLMSCDGGARPAGSPKIGAAYSPSASSSGAAAAAPGSPKTCSSPLPKWVEQDRQVCWGCIFTTEPVSGYDRMSELC